MRFFCNPTFQVFGSYLALAGTTRPNKPVKGMRRPSAVLKFSIYQGLATSFKLSERCAPYRNVKLFRMTNTLLRMKNKFLVIWKDAVWSKIIATAIISGTLWCWSFLSSNTFNIFLGIAFTPIILPLWGVLLLCFAPIYFGAKYLANIKLKKPYISNPRDIIAIIDSWWPKSSDGFPQDVTVDFEELEKKYNLSPGGVNNVIDEVAEKNGYTVKFRGEKIATFSYQIPPFVTV